MGEAVGQILPLAVGVAISPLPIVAVVLMLVTAHGRANGPAFLIGWFVGLGIVGAIVLSAAAGAGATDEGDPATWVGVLQLVLGVGLLLVGLRQWRSRPAAGEEPPTPKWMGALDEFTAVKALGAGVVLSGLNPKNLLLAAGAAAAIAGFGLSDGDEVVAYLVFVVIGSLGVGIPVVLYFVMGERSQALLQSLKTWMGHNNAVIMAVLMLVIGAKLIGDAITGLSG